MNYPGIDLDAYFQRVGFDGAARPEPKTLARLAECHAASIAFENLDPLLGLPVELAPAAVEDKLVRRGRGGYCYEQNRLFADVLEKIGFEVTALAARVLWNRPPDAITARSHMLLRVDVDGVPWLVDVGFGGLTLTGALRLVADTEQATPHEPFRLLESNGEWRLQAHVGGEWKALYRFDLQAQHPIDYEASNYLLSTHPESHFVRNLMVARSLPGQRLALMNTELAIHPLGAESRRRRLRDVDELTDVLEREFGLAIPRPAQWRERLQALFR
jgi:N-hydroxyarylamine O-acetyltransferase